MSEVKLDRNRFISDKNIYRIKYVLYATSFIWVLYLYILFHEFGHAVTVLSLGGTLHDFIVTWDLRGRVLWSWENIPQSIVPRVVTLVNVSGGIGAALFFMILAHKSKWFTIPAMFALLDGFGEAMYQADTRCVASYGVGIPVVFICLWLFWQFETQHQNDERKQLKKLEALIDNEV